MTAHLRAQLLRFARMTGYAIVAQYVGRGGQLPLTWSTLTVLLPGAAETLLRQAFRVTPAPAVTAVPAPPGSTP